VLTVLAHVALAVHLPVKRLSNSVGGLQRPSGVKRLDARLHERSFTRGVTGNGVTLAVVLVSVNSVLVLLCGGWVSPEMGGPPAGRGWGNCCFGLIPRSHDPHDDSGAKQCDQPCDRAAINGALTQLTAAPDVKRDIAVVARCMSRTRGLHEERW
jgi:hypothetical protein